MRTRAHNGRTGPAATPRSTGEITSRLNSYFDTAAFSINEPYTFGNAPRLMPNLRAPGMRNFDVSVFKNFTLREKLRVQFRSEFFNIFNTPQFGFPDSNLNSRIFGPP